MKNLFKKSNKKATKVISQELKKEQLAKVIGGGDTTTQDSTNNATPRYIVKSDGVIYDL